jgi:hypothetical protein
MSFSQRESPAGQPSTTTPMPAPWDSPQVVTVNNFPNDEPAMLSLREFYFFIIIIGKILLNSKFIFISVKIL